MTVFPVATVKSSTTITSGRNKVFFCLFSSLYAGKNDNTLHFTINIVQLIYTCSSIFWRSEPGVE